MRLRGRRFLTRTFLCLTGVVIVGLVVGSAYLVVAPSDALQRLLAVPVAGSMLWIFYRFAQLVGLHHHIEFFFRMTGLSLMMGYAVRISERIPIQQLKAIPKKLWKLWSR